MEENRDFKFTDELESILKKIPNDEIIYFQSIISQSNGSIAHYCNNLYITEVGSNGESK